MENASQNLQTLDLDQARNAALAFYQVSGINVTLIDPQANILYICDEKKAECEFCKRLRFCSGERIDCNRVRLYGSYQAERFGGRYIFFCPMGLVFFASPLSLNGRMQASYIGGPVLMTEPEEFLLEDTVAQHADARQTDWHEIEAMLREIPQCSPVKVRYLSEQLFMTAAFVCGQGNHYFDETAHKESQQSDISEYVHTIKMQNPLETSTYPIEKEKELIHAIETGDKKASQILLNEILGHIFFSSGRDFDIIRARVLELVVVLSRAALDGGADMEQIFGLNYTYLNEINSYKTVEDLSYWLSRLMTRFTDCVFNLVNVKHVDIIYKSITFMRENHDRKLTLEDVAREVHLSPSYFSRIFKEEMHTNFNSYLNKIRINRAKQLLLRDDINLVDISNLVGYEDQSYFSKVFKKVTGVSPGKFRELRGNIVSRTTLVSQSPF